VTQQTLDPGATVEVNDCNPATGPEIFSQLRKVADAIVDVVVGVGSKN